MHNRPGIHFCIASAAILALGAIAFAAVLENPQGQYHLAYSPLGQFGTTSTGSLATYSPIKSVDGRTIQLRGDDGVTYAFTLTADTVYCQGGLRVSDWTYLKTVPRKHSVTVLTVDDVNLKAIVIWDKAPSIDTSGGRLNFTLPPMCK
ncbi:MAG: hypothetical protein WAN35_10325 [Terracidiphilus sp.]|jgi:hypothetical protein